jgi:hypothetical protein
MVNTGNLAEHRQAERTCVGSLHEVQCHGARDTVHHHVQVMAELQRDPNGAQTQSHPAQLLEEH